MGHKSFIQEVISESMVNKWESRMGGGKANTGALTRGLAPWANGARTHGVLRHEEYPSVLFSWNQSFITK